MVEDESGFRNLTAEFHNIGKFGRSDTNVKQQPAPSQLPDALHKLGSPAVPGEDFWIVQHLPDSLEVGVFRIVIQKLLEPRRTRVRGTHKALHGVFRILTVGGDVINFLLLLVRMGVHLHVNGAADGYALRRILVIRHAETLIQHRNPMHPRQVQAFQIPEVLVCVRDLQHVWGIA